MVAGFRIESWHGRVIADKVLAAAVGAIDETTQAAASQAASMRSGRAANVTSEPAAGTPPTGRWGVFPEPGGDPFWELFVEVGGPGHAGDNAKRRAADAEYSGLADRIRSRM